MSGKVYLVGAGPGDPDLLTLRALRLLQNAEVVLHDDLVTPEILALTAPTARVQNVGKRCGARTMPQEEINFLLVTLAESGRDVLRLKSGDPLIFGRAGEEMEALRRANIAYEIVPGVTSPLGAAAGAGIPLTHRRYSSTLVLTTGHQAEEHSPLEWKPFATARSTLVIYMPGHDYAAIARKLTDAGFADQIPCAIVSRATTSDQRVYFTDVAHLQHSPRLPVPTLLVVGETVKFAEQLGKPEKAVTVPNQFVAQQGEQPA